MRFDGYIGPSYQPSSYAVDVQRTINWYTERVEKPGARKNAFSLRRTPGRSLYLDPGLGPGMVRGMFGVEGYLFAVVNNKLIEQFPDGHFTVSAINLANDGKPAYLAASPTTIFVVSGGNGYIQGPNPLAQIGSSFPTGLAKGAFSLDGYFGTAVSGTNYFQISNLNDATTWDPTQKGVKAAHLDFLHQVAELNREIWGLGSQTMQVFDDVGDIDFPFSIRTDVKIDMGIYADDSLVNLGNVFYMLVGNNIGINIAMRTQGYALQRISDHPFEQFLDQNFTSDAVGYCYEENGHLFYMLYFPTADRTWGYDVSTGQWHERTWLDPNTGIEHADRNYCSATVNGKILVGDRLDGKIYQLSENFKDDNGQLIRRTRIAPCIADQLRNITHDTFMLDANMGLGADGISNVDDPMYDPKMMLSWSNDGGKTFGNEHWRGFGRIGEYKRRAIWRRLGYARRRVYKTVVTAPADWGIAGCYINPTEEELRAA